MSIDELLPLPRTLTHYKHLMESKEKLNYGDFSKCFGIDLSMVLYERYMMQGRQLVETNDITNINDFNQLVGDVLNPEIGKKYYVLHVALANDGIVGDRWAYGTLANITTDSNITEYVLDLLYGSRESFVEINGIIRAKALFFDNKRSAKQFMMFLKLKGTADFGKLIEANLGDCMSFDLSRLVSLHKIGTTHFVKQLEVGLKEETEHNPDLKIARKIALEHLKEDPNYYIKMEKTDESI